MKMSPSPEAGADADFEQQYSFLLREYANGGGESALGRAYELGRQAMQAEARGFPGFAGKTG